MLTIICFLWAAGLVGYTLTEFWLDVKRDQGRLTWLEKVHAKQERDRNGH